jgi:hypothetical protein
VENETAESVHKARHIDCPDSPEAKCHAHCVELRQFPVGFYTAKERTD